MTLPVPGHEGAAEPAYVVQVSRCLGEPHLHGAIIAQSGVVIGRLHHIVLDCRGPEVLATFYSELLGLPITYRSDDWVVVSERPDTSGLAFQLAPDHGRRMGDPTGRNRSTWT